MIIHAILMSSSLVFAQGTVLVEPVDQSQGATTLYKLQFSLPDTLGKTEVISVTFPPSFDLSGVNIVASTLIKGGLQAEIHGNTVVAIRKGLGELIPAGTSVDLLFSAVKNPVSQDGSYILKVSFHENLAEFLTKVTDGAFVPSGSALQGTIGIIQVN